MRKHAWFVLPALLLGAGIISFTPRTARALNPNHDCAFCHSLHNAPGSKLTNDLDVEVLCMSCHGPTGISTFKAEVHLNDNNSSYAPFRITCMQCHDPHSDQSNWLGPHDDDGVPVDGINIKLVGFGDASGVAVYDGVKWDVGTSSYLPRIRDVVFEQRGSGITGNTIHSFADADEDGNGVKDGACETCHTQTKFHCTDDAGNPGDCRTTHNRGKTCTTHHDHDNFFQR